jgi:hypothetical protein
MNTAPSHALQGKVICRSFTASGRPVDTISCDDMQLSLDELRWHAAEMNRYLVSQGSQLQAIYLLV